MTVWPILQPSEGFKVDQRKNREYVKKIFLSMILLILQYAKLLFYTSDTVDSKLLNPLSEDPKTNIEAPREVWRLTENSIFYIFVD